MANMSILYLLALSLSVLAKHTANKRDSYIEERIPMTEEERQEHLNKFLEEWGQHMVDFIPSDMLAFEILAGRSRTIYENVKAAPILFRGAYSVSAEDSYKLGATIYDPQGNIIFSKKHAREAIIYLFLNVTGTYTIVFENKNVMVVASVVLFERGGAVFDSDIEGERFVCGDSRGRALRQQNLPAHRERTQRHRKRPQRRHGSAKVLE
eukprot:TRINITY_DN9561_c0_g2_i2.p1 TRINITY_DN9561_c0_g2~~TRINITY_DN9561_c0_g2_i2.p1  ORF type:complete len:209 (-),score=23.99 TRINITY_DN9561_c0_g2_i2:202-828(-)